MPEYEHLCTDCEFEWNDTYSINKDPPTHCPKCNKKTAKRLISGGSGKGIVELSGQEYNDKIKADAQKLKQEVYGSEKAYANVLGENRYHDLQTKMDRRKR